MQRTQNLPNTTTSLKTAAEQHFSPAGIQHSTHHRCHLAQLAAWLLIVLIVLQHAEMLVCRQVDEFTGRSKRLFSVEAESAQNGSPDLKRTLIDASDGGGNNGQPEEIFSIGNQLDANYDEYPMVVPKRAALLLDRLMLALHRALEHEHNNQGRVAEFYTKHLKTDDHRSETTEKDKAVDDDVEQVPIQHSEISMYSDDDPSVVMDYDFKDLNSINRATGETLMAKSFQRRANLSRGGGSMAGSVGTGADRMAMLSSSLTVEGGGNAGDAGRGIVGSGRTNVGSSGRMYWRCYFNAVSCF